MKKVFVLVLILILVFPQAVLAQTNPCTAGPQASIGRCVTQIYKWSLAAAALLAILMVVLGGYKVMTAQGNAEQSTSGKGMIMSAIVGLSLLFGAYLILNTINPDLVKFRDFSGDPFQAQQQQNQQQNQTSEPVRGNPTNPEPPEGQEPE